MRKATLDPDDFTASRMAARNPSVTRSSASRSNTQGWRNAVLLKLQFRCAASSPPNILVLSAYVRVTTLAPSRRAITQVPSVLPESKTWTSSHQDTELRHPGRSRSSFLVSTSTETLLIFIARDRLQHAGLDPPTGIAAVHRPWFRQRLGDDRHCTHNHPISNRYPGCDKHSRGDPHLLSYGNRRVN